MSRLSRRDQLKATQQTTEFLETVLRVSTDGVVVIDTAQRVLLANDAFCALLGRSPADLEQTSLPTWLEQLPAGAPRQWGILQQRVCRDGTCRNVEFHVTTDEGWRDLSVNASLLRRPDDEPDVIVSVWRDVTDCHRCEQKYQDLVEKEKDVIYTLDAEGIITFASPAVEAMLGYRPEELQGRHYALLVDDDVKEPTESDFQRLLTAGETCSETVLLDRNGERHFVEYSSTTIEEGGVVVGTRGIVRDITDRRRAEQERKRLIEELEAKNIELEDFTYTVSHDLRAPLLTIHGFASALAEDVAAGNVEDVQEDLDCVTKAADKMQQLIEGLLALARIGRQAGEPEEIDLGELAYEVVHVGFGSPHETKVDVEIAPGLPTVFGDRTRLWEVLQNLIENAVKFMGDQPQPRIEISCRRDGDQPVCYVCDNGSGIDPCHRERVFRPFDQLDPSRGGTGIGLSLVKRIIEVHGGRIWVESEGLGHGSTFCFTLPEKEAS